MVEGNSLVGKDLRDEQPLIHNISRQVELWCIIPSGRDSKFSQSSIYNFFSVVGSSPFGKHLRDGHAYTSKDSSADEL